jgi:hypothetical protein
MCAAGIEETAGAMTMINAMTKRNKFFICRTLSMIEA